MSLKLCNNEQHGRVISPMTGQLLSTATIDLQKAEDSSMSEIETHGVLEDGIQEVSLVSHWPNG